MQTYGSYSGYRPHLDSADFLHTLRAVVVIGYLLAIVFSVRGNWMGLAAILNIHWIWLLCIALAITLPEAILSMLPVMKLPGLKRSGRILSIVGVILLFYVSTRLTLVGFRAGEEASRDRMVQEHADVVQARKDLDEIVRRQRQYGLSTEERRSLIQREKDQRVYLRETEMRVRVELGYDSKSRAELAMGTEAELARQLFAAAPELAIIALSPVIVLLFGLAGSSAESSASAAQPRLVYVPVQQSAGQTVSIPQQSSGQLVPSGGERGVDGRLPSQAIPEKVGWDPFSGSG